MILSDLSLDVITLRRAWRLGGIVLLIAQSSCRQLQPDSGTLESLKRVSIDNYALWQVHPDGYVSWTDTLKGRVPLVLDRYQLPTLESSQSKPVRLTQTLNLIGMSHWGLSLGPAGATMKAIRSVTDMSLPDVQALRSKDAFLAGILAATSEYVCSFLYFPDAQTDDCGMGLAKYKLSRAKDGHVILDQDFCLQHLKSEFSGFINDQQNICYIISRSYRIEENGEVRWSEEVLAVKKDGALVPVQLPPSRWTLLIAAPDKTGPSDIIVGINRAHHRKNRWPS